MSQEEEIGKVEKEAWGEDREGQAVERAQREGRRWRKND